MGWNQIRWTEARQVASLLDIDEVELPDEGVAPEDHYRSLREGNEVSAALSFMGAALPRYEALAWAGRILEQEATDRELPRADRQALDHSLRWLGEQSEHSRRAARAASEAAGEKSPEKLLALGVFFSGGSISEPDLPPVPPEPQIAGRFASVAIIMAAGRADERMAVINRALDLGEQIAEHGTRALDAA